MDPLSQAVAGATFSQSLSRNRAGQKLAFVAGALSGMAADLDILLHSDTDPLLFLEFHRQFTHSLVFIPVGGLIVAAFLFPFMKRHVSFAQAWLLTTLGYASHGLLDACTSYGTQLFWPFSDHRVAWDIISIIDPLFTLPILALVVASFLSRRAKYAQLGLAYGLLYLTLGAFQHGRAMDALEVLAADRGHTVSDATVKPTLGNLYLWKTIYAHDGRYYVDAVKAGTDITYIQGESIANGVRKTEGVTESVQLRDIERFRWFSSGYIAYYPGDPLIIGDIRYSLLPNSIEPLWGIRLKPDRPHEHVDYVVSRDLTTKKRMQFFSMLFGTAAY